MTFFNGDSSRSKPTLMDEECVGEEDSEVGSAEANTKINTVANIVANTDANTVPNTVANTTVNTEKIQKGVTLWH